MQSSRKVTPYHQQSSDFYPRSPQVRQQPSERTVGVQRRQRLAIIRFASGAYTLSNLEIINFWAT